MYTHLLSCVTSVLRLRDAARGRLRSQLAAAQISQRKLFSPPTSRRATPSPPRPRRWRSSGARLRRSSSSPSEQLVELLKGASSPSSVATYVRHLGRCDIRVASQFLRHTGVSQKYVSTPASWLWRKAFEIIMMGSFIEETPVCSAPVFHSYGSSCTMIQLNF